VKLQQSRWPQHDGGSQDPRRPHQRGAQTSDNAMRGLKVGSPLPTTIQNQYLVSQQNGFCNHGTDSTGSTKPNDDADRMQKKCENVVHAQDGSKVKKPKNSERLRNSPPTRSSRSPRLPGITPGNFQEADQQQQNPNRFLHEFDLRKFADVRVCRWDCCFVPTRKVYFGSGESSDR